MNRRQKELIQLTVEQEKDILSKLKKIYEKAERDIDNKIAALLARTDIVNIQSIIYQVDYQRALKRQISGILDELNARQFDSITEYLTECYENGFIGVLYDLQGQGIPLIFPIAQDEVIKALTVNTKLSKRLYTKLGEDVDELKKLVRNELSRGISQGYSYADIARNVRNQTSIGIYRAMRIARTEGHRITAEATLDAQHKAKDAGADVVKQWDSTLDRRTRRLHAELDGQIRDIDEPFVINGYKAQYPGGFGVASMDVNCRCALLQRAKWALDDEETKWLGDVAGMSGEQKERISNKIHVPVDELQKYSNQIIPVRAKSYTDFKRQYKKIWNYEGSDFQKKIEGAE